MLDSVPEESGTKRSFVSALRAPAFWLALGLFALEFFLFDRFGSHRHARLYPRWFDQIQYLSECYMGYEYARFHGFAQGLWQTLVNPSAQGTLHDFFALLIFYVAGPSRSAALSLNLLAFLAWQISLLFAVARLSGSRPLALAAAALPLALVGPWQSAPGSAYDFRLDHLTMCALGITLAVALLTDRFRSLPWSLALGAAVGLTLLTRFLTGTYFVLIFLVALAWVLCAAGRGRRVVNLLLAGLVAAGVAAPVFWLNRDWIWNYYWIGHFVGPESALRSPHLGLTRSLQFVAVNLGQRHLGLHFAALAVVGATALGLLSRGERLRGAGHFWFLGALFFLAPAFVLTLHEQKSDVVLSALVPGVVALVVALWLAAARTGKDGLGLRLVSTGVVLAALAFFTSEQVRPAYDAGTLADLRQVNGLADMIHDRSQAAEIREPRVAVDAITDCLDAQVLRVIFYERQHKWVTLHMMLPTSIAEPTSAEVMERLARSDFVFLTEEAPPGGWPYDQKLASLRPQVRAWCEAHAHSVRRFTLQGRHMVLYERQ